MECKSLRESGKALREFEVAYFGASCDPPEKNKEFAKKLDLDYPLLSDPGKETARKYGVVYEGRGLPERWTYFIGKDGKILHVDKEVKVGDHGNAIAKKLGELGVEKKAD